MFRRAHHHMYRFAAVGTAEYAPRPQGNARAAIAHPTAPQRVFAPNRETRANMKHVAVLMGGWSAEREVSLRSGAACADALERGGGYRVTRVDVGRDVAAVLTDLRPDVALNLLHGRPGEDGTIQGLLE